MERTLNAQSARPAAKRSSSGPRLASVMAVEVVRAASRPDVSVEELSRLALSDPAFTFRILSFVNSAALGRGRHISDVGQASALLGLRGLQTVGISLIVSDMVPLGEAGELLLVLALRRALAARWVATELRLTNPDSYFSVGLLLEMGLFALAADAPDMTLKIAQLPATHRPLYEEVRGLQPHPKAGAALAARFQLPEHTVQAIAHHHDAAPPTDTTARVAWCAERIASVFEAAAVSLAGEQLLELCPQFDLSVPRLEEFLSQLPQQVEDAARAFEREVAPQLDLAELRADAAARLLELNQQLEDTVATLRQLVAEKEVMSQQLAAANQQLAAANQQLAQINDALAQEAVTDPLTGLPNRRALERELARDLARGLRNGSALSVLMLDIDHFKRINDGYGHIAGDAVLKEIGQKLNETLRKGDFAARFGGEEFCVVLPDTDESASMLAARRIRLAIERCEVKFQGQVIKVTTSIGVATDSPANRGPRDGLVTRADAALYRAKAGGRNCVVADGKELTPVISKAV